MLPPTSYLPPIKLIRNNSVQSLTNGVQYLRLIYNPPVRGSRRKGTTAKSVITQHDSKVLDDFRTDNFERSYAMKWLTALIAYHGELEVIDNGQEEERTALIEDAASLLAICAGTASAGVITRRFTFQIAGLATTPIGINLTDVPLDNQDYGSVGAQTWGGACVMAEMIAESPAEFGLEGKGRQIRCLELGAGTGLVSLAAAKVAEHLGIDVDIVATDYYPTVLVNLERNVKANVCQVKVSTHPLDWSKSDNLDKNLTAGFDVVFGADIIYESLHATWIKACVEKLLHEPSHSNPNPTFHLIIPLRATHSAESSTVKQVFNDNEKLVIKQKEIIICDTESGKDGEEIEYAYFKIGWSNSHNS